MKLKTLNANGFTHNLLLVLFVVVFGIIGAYYIVSSRAATIDGQDEASALRTGPPATKLLLNSPINSTSKVVVQNEIINNIRDTPTGGTIMASLYQLEIGAIKTNLKAAHDRGVHVKLVVNVRNVTAAEKTVLENYRDSFKGKEGSQSYVRLVGSSARSNDTTSLNHNKIYMFSSVKSAKWVVMVGNYNATVYNRDHQYSQMLQSVGNQSIYDKFSSIFNEQLQLARSASPFRSYSGTNWEAYFLPSPNMTASSDPAMKILKKIPVNGNSTVRISMYAMHDDRGNWLADQLVRMKKAGVKIYFEAGPDVGPQVSAKLKKAGVVYHVADYGTAPNKHHTHAKDISATWMSGGSRKYAVWVGSDNWGADSEGSDNAMLGMYNKALFDQFTTNFNRIHNHK